ncbi:MAG: hypothetical protein ACYS0H_28415, partial [Planctomycetota bacterium]
VFKKSKRLSRGDKEELQKENETRIQTEAGRFSLDEDAVLGVYALMTPPFTRNKLRTILYFAGTVCSILALILFVVLFVLNRTSNLSPWAFLSSLGLLVVPISKWVYSKFFQKDPFKIVLSRIKTHLKDVRIIVFGHTHDPDIRVVNNEYSYFNTGTWTTVFSEEERIIRESKQFSFVWIKEVDGEPSAELLRWSDCLKRPAKIMLFQQKS